MQVPFDLSFVVVAAISHFFKKKQLTSFLWIFHICRKFVVCLFLWTPSFEGNWVSLMGFSLTSGAGINGNAPYQAQELQITTLANPGIQTNFLSPRPVQS